jgi:hypothetical protein
MSSIVECNSYNKEINIKVRETVAMDLPLVTIESSISIFHSFKLSGSSHTITAVH